MRFGKIIIRILTVLLLGVVLVVSTREESTDRELTAESFSVLVKSGDWTEEIQCWTDSEGAYYVFLPGYAQMKQVYLLYDDLRIIIDNTPVLANMSCERFELDTAYPFSCIKDEWQMESTITFVRSSDIPAMYIDVLSGSMDYIHLEKGNAETGEMRLYDAGGELLHSVALDAVEGRGNSSWAAEKKPYNLILKQAADLLGMGKAQRWILLAEGYLSCINIRNKIVYDYAEAVGMDCTPDGEWVNLYLNGEYAGLYLLSERNEIHPERVNLSRETGMLVSLESEIRLEDQKYPYILTDSGQALRIHHSALSTIELDTLWQRAENAIMAKDGIDPESGKHWQELIDLDSWAEKYLLEELFGNHDGGSFSQFFYCDVTRESGRIYAGPIWDYDLAMGGYDVWLKPYTDYFVMDRDQKEEGLYTPWFYALYQKEEFRERVIRLYQEKYLPAMEQILKSRLPDYIEVMEGAFNQDALRWEYSQKEVEKELEYICIFLEERMDFLSDVWINGTEYCIVRVDTGRRYVYGYLAVKPGTYLPELPPYESYGGQGWFVVGTEEPFDITQPIWEDVQIYVKIESFQIPKIHYVPLFALLFLLLVLFACDRLRIKKNGRVRHDPAKTR